jgi:phage-related protein
MPQIRVVLYKEADGSIPTLDWLSGLPTKARDKCIKKIERLKELGHEIRRPEADYLRDDIYELRTQFLSVQYRLLYFFHGREAAVVSHGMTKRKRVPSSEIEKAIERRRKFLQNPEQYTHEIQIQQIQQIHLRKG